MQTTIRLVLIVILLAYCVNGQGARGGGGARGGIRGEFSKNSIVNYAITSFCRFQAEALELVVEARALANHAQEPASSLAVLWVAFLV